MFGITCFHMAQVILVTEHERLGAVVDLGKKKVGFWGKKGQVDLSTAHIIDELPEDALYRNVHNETLEEAANAYVQRRNPRWKINIF